MSEANITELTADEKFMIIAVVVTVAAIIYLIQSICIYRIAKKSELNERWMAWIPILGLYVLNQVPHKKFTMYNPFKGETVEYENRNKMFVIYILVKCVAMVMPSILSIILMVVVIYLQFYILRDWLEVYNNQGANTLLAIVCSVSTLGFLIVLIIFSLQEPIYTGSYDDYIKTVNTQQKN